MFRHGSELGFNTRHFGRRDIPSATFCAGFTTNFAPIPGDYRLFLYDVTGLGDPAYSRLTAKKFDFPDGRCVVDTALKTRLIRVKLARDVVCTSRRPLVAEVARLLAPRHYRDTASSLVALYVYPRLWILAPQRSFSR